MKLKFAIFALMMAVLLTGCAGANVGVRAGNSTLIRGGAPLPGSSYSYASVQAEGNPNAYFGTVFLGSVLFGFQGDDRRMSSGASWRKPPDLVEGRAIAERDCSKPLGQIEGNLRCK